MAFRRELSIRLFGATKSASREISHFNFRADEFESLMSQFATLDEAGSSRELMRSQFATTSRRNIRYRSWVFTEHGALQAANILRSDRAIAMNTMCGDAVGCTALVAWGGDRAIGRLRVNVYVIRAFIE